jgi:hypothetical protein
MNRQAQMELLEELRAQLADIERQQQDPTLPHSDQQLLDQAWDDYTNQIDELEEILELADRFDEDHWRDAAQFLEEAEPDEPPPSVTLQTWVRSDGALMTGIPPRVSFETQAPPPPAPRPPTPVPPDVEMLANAPPLPDDDEEMDTESDSAMEVEDDRDDCRYCSGCMYCQDNDGYDPSGEI